MENQGKRLLVAVALALGVMLVWNMVFPPKKDEPAPTPGSATNAPALVQATSKVGKSTEGPVAPAPGTRGEEQLITLEFPKFTASFSSWTGGLVAWKLADARFENDQTHGQMLPSERDTGAFQVNFSKSTYVLPPGLEWKGTKVSDTEVRYETSTEHVDVENTFTVIPEAYLVRLVTKAKVKVPAGKLADQTLAVTVFAFQDPDKIVEGAGQGQARAWHSSTMRGDTIFHTPIGSLLEKPRLEENVTWTGFEHPYLLAAYAPRPNGAPAADKQTFAVTPKGLMRTDILFERTTLRPGDPPLTQELVAYLGPKNYNALEAADALAGFSTGFKETIDLGWFSFIGKPLLWLMLQFHAFFGNWGIAIIVLTILVKLATLYWTTKSMRSMKAMAALAPQMKTLQAKYKGDNRRLQAETMALYQKHKVSPVAGCLPIFLQMPIWLALYRMLSSAGELYQAPFIPGWINDLTATDPYHVLPFVLLVTMFAQARLTPATGDSRQQKMLQYGMPLMFGVMAFFFPSGLTLYIFTNTILSALHSIYMNKYDKKTKAAVDAIKKGIEEAAAAEAKAAGGKPSGGKAGAGKNGAAKPAKAASKVIDVEAVEHDEADATEAEGETAEAGGPARSAPRPRNKPRKKRRK